MKPENNVELIETILRTSFEQLLKIKDFQDGELEHFLGNHAPDSMFTLVAELMDKKGIVVDNRRKVKYTVHARMNGIIIYLDSFPDTERARQFERRYHELYKSMHDGKDIDTFVETCYLN